MTFAIPPPLSAAAFGDLITNYLERASSAFEFVSTTLRSISPHRNEIPDLDNPGRSTQTPEYDEGKALTAYVKSNRNADGKFAAFTLDGLDGIERTHGRQSDEYKNAAQGLKNFFESVRDQLTHTFCVVSDQNVHLPGRPSET